MPDLYDLTIEHIPEDSGRNETDFWERETLADAMRRIAWHALNSRVVSVQLDAIEPVRPAEPVLGVFKGYEATLANVEGFRLVGPQGPTWPPAPKD